MTVPSLAKQTEQAGKTEKRLGHSVKTAKPQSQREDHANNNNKKSQYKCTQNDLITFPGSVTTSQWDPRNSGSVFLLLFLRPVLGSPG